MFDCVWTIFCSVKASSININIFTDGDSNNEVSDSCINSACNQLCLRLGFAGGVCVGDKCKCDNFVNDVNSISNNEVSGNCVNIECYEMCRRLHFTAGYCEYDNCRCVYDVDIHDKKSDVRSCNNVSCDRMCRRQGFPAGECIGGKCRCDSNDALSMTTVVSDSWEGCETLTCHHVCTKLGFTGAACSKDDKCYCFNFKTKGHTHRKLIERKNNYGEGEHGRMSNKHFKDASPVKDWPDCDFQECNTTCKNINYFGGVCMPDGSCRCF